MRVTSLLILALVVIHPWTLCMQPLDSVNSSGDSDYIRFSSDISTIAVPEGFHHTTWANYSDVAVVINNQSQDSVIIGEAFAAARGIPEERIFRLTNESTPTGETINAGQFDEFFADPIRQMMLNRSLGGEISYIVTTKGIPLRVNGGTNARASFDSELALIDSAQYSPAIHANYWTEHSYGPWSNTGGQDYSSYSETPVPIFNRIDQGFYIVTRLTGYDANTALGLIDLSNESFGSRGTTVLDLATNRNSFRIQVERCAIPHRWNRKWDSWSSQRSSTRTRLISQMLIRLSNMLHGVVTMVPGRITNYLTVVLMHLMVPQAQASVHGMHLLLQYSIGEASDWYWDDSIKKNGKWSGISRNFICTISQQMVKLHLVSWLSILTIRVCLTTLLSCQISRSYPESFSFRG